MTEGYHDRIQLHETDSYDEAKGWLAGYQDRIQFERSRNRPLHETDSYDEAKGWLAGYVRFDGLKQSGYDCIIIREGLDPRSMFDQSGWTHY